MLYDLKAVRACDLLEAPHKNTMYIICKSKMRVPSAGHP